MIGDIVQWVLDPPQRLQSVYELFGYVGLDDRVVDDLVPRVVREAYEDLRSRRDGRARAQQRSSRNMWTSFPDPAQFLQGAALRALSEGDASHNRVPGWYVVRYLSALVESTLFVSAFRLAVGIGGVLSNGSNDHILRLYDTLSPHSGQKDPRQVRKARTKITRYLGRTLGHLIRTDPDCLPITIPRARTPDDEVTKILAQMIPSGTQHVPKGHEEYHRLVRDCSRYGHPSWDLLASHVLLDQANCFRLVSLWDRELEGAFVEWQLPVPHPSLGSAAGGPWEPPAGPPKAPTAEQILRLVKRLRSGS